jgi:glycopeptide antibiotics resistance protein
MYTRTARFASAALLVLVLIGAFLPGHDKHLLLDPFPSPWRVDKIGHAVGFMATMFSFDQARFRGVRRWHIAVFALLLGAFTEFGQTFIEGRTPAVADVLIDTAGGIVGLFVAALVTRSRAEMPKGRETARIHR